MKLTELKIPLDSFVMLFATKSNQNKNNTVIMLHWRNLYEMISIVFDVDFEY